MSAIREYLRVFLPLMGIFIAYQVLAVPFFEPAVVPKERVYKPEMTVAVNRWWSDYFPKEDWRNSSPRILQTSDGVLLFENWEQLGPDRWKLEPLTIIMLQSKTKQPTDSKSAAGATFVEAPQGAEIQFKSAIDWTTGRPPPVVGGQLLGPIRIFSPPTVEGGPPSMLIETRDLRIDKRHIWTDQQVRMDLGQSRIRGRSLEIFLDKDLLSQSSTPSAGDTPFEGLDHMELVYVDEVHVGLANGGLWAKQKQSDATATPVTNDKPASIDVFCRGSFHFDFHTSLASVNDGVQVVHRVAGMPDDRFDCHSLAMHFDWTSQRTAGTTTASSLRDVDKASIDKFEARGRDTDDKRDASRLVQLEAPGILARGRGRWLEVDLKYGQIAISNRLPGSTESESDPAYLERDNVQIWSPEIRFQNNELAVASSVASSPQTLDDADQQPRMGKVYADGPGQARMRTKDGDNWKLSWSNVLTLQADGPEDRLTIDGSANVSSDSQGQFSAEKLELWLFQLSNRQRERFLAQDPTKEPPQVLPNRIHAAGAVNVKSQLLRAQVDDLQTWFVYPILSANTESRPTPPLPQDLVRSPRSPENAPGLATPNGPGQLANTRFGPAPGMQTPPQRKEPISVTGRTLRSRILMVGDETSVDDLVIDGDVTMTRSQLSATTPMPLTITGKMVQMNTADGGKSDIKIVGQPAKIQIGSGWLEGPEIRFKERDQLVWMEKPGFIVIPPEAMAKEAPPSPLGQFAPPPKPKSNLEWIEPIRIEWQGQLRFDGKMAKIDGGVRMRGRAKTGPDTIWHMQGTSQELELILSKPIVMSTESSNESEIRNIVLKGEVDLRGAQTDLQGNRRSLEHLMVPQLDIDIIDQTLLGYGPGSLRSRRLASAMPGAKSNSPISSTSNSGLACLHLIFVGKMEGEFGLGMVRFVKGVEAVDGPINSWDDELNVRAIRQLAVDQKLITCDVLQIQNVTDLSWNRTSGTTSTQDGSSVWEIEARDSVKLDGLSNAGMYNLLASRVRYNSAHELLHIEGSAQLPAEITMQQQPGTAPNRVVVRSADYDIGANSIRNAQIAQIQVDIPDKNNPNAAPGNPFQPKPPNANALPDPRNLNPKNPR